jgi:hypothetical protein
MMTMCGHHLGAIDAFDGDAAEPAAFRTMPHPRIMSRSVPAKKDLICEALQLHARQMR